MSDRLRKLAASIAMGSALAAAAPAAAQDASAPEVKIGMIDNGSSAQAIKDKNAKLISKVMHNGVQAGWTGDAYYSHGDLVAISAVQAARAAAPSARITVYAANVYAPSDSKDLQKIHYRLMDGAIDKAIDWFKKEGVKVVVFTGTSRDTQQMRDLSSHVKAAGMTLVASTNNAPSAEKVYPAAYPEVIAVAGEAPTLQISKSPLLASYVSYVAPGAAFKNMEVGSSFAAGTVAGYAAVAASLQDNPTKETISAWLDARGPKASYSGVEIATLPSADLYQPIRSKGPVVASAEIPKVAVASIGR